jgi:hypothetical protein
MDNYWIFALLAIVVVAVVLVWRLAGRTRSRVQLRDAVGNFESQLDGLAGELVQKAGAAGKPRGLRWKAAQLGGPPTFAMDQRSELYALIGATISFEAIEGGGMEDVEAVGNLRSATAVFVHRKGTWTTDGRVIFNLEPREALARFDAQLTEYREPPAPPA